MDPDENLKEQLHIACYLVDSESTESADAERGQRLAELVLALNGWIQSGGALPGMWEAAQSQNR